MAQDSANVRVAVTGVVSVAPTGSTAPTDANTALNAAFKDLGYVSEDGVTETRSRTTQQIRAWQNADLVREVVTESDLSYQLALIETKVATVELYYGNTVTAGNVKIVPSKTGGRQAFVIDVIDDDKFIRTYIPEGEVVEVGDQVFQSGAPVGYQVTIKAYSTDAITDADGNNAAAEKWYSSIAS